MVKWEDQIGVRQCCNPSLSAAFLPRSIVGQYVGGNPSRTLLMLSRTSLTPDSPIQAVAIAHLLSAHLTFFFILI